LPECYALRGVASSEEVWELLPESFSILQFRRKLELGNEEKSCFIAVEEKVRT
jgi:hypothetical protein